MWGRPNVWVDLRSTEISLINDREMDLVDEGVKLIDSDRVRVELRLAYQLKRGGVRRVNLFAPYILYNLTGLRLGVANNTVVKANQEVAGLACNNAAVGQSDAKALMYAYPESIALRDRVKIRVAASEWSSPVSLETVGGGHNFAVQDPASATWYNLAMAVRLGPAKYEACKIVQVMPRYVFANQTAFELHLSDGGETQGVVCGPAGQRPVHFSPSRLDALVLLYGDTRTARFSATEVGKLYLLAPGTREGLLRVDRVLQGSTIFIAVREEATWPFVLVNHSSIDLQYQQRPWDDHAVPTAGALFPAETANFTWEEPSCSDKRLVIQAGNKRIPINIYDIGQLQPIMLKVAGGEKKSLSIDIVADGPVLQVIFRDYDASKSLFQYRRRQGSSPALAADAQAEEPKEQQFEVKSVEVLLTSVFRLRFPSISVTLINRHLEEVVYVWAKDLELRYSVSNLHVTYGLTVAWLQIDNQLFDDWDHPILLYPAVISKKAQFKRGGDEDPPCLSAALIQSVDSAHGVRYYKYFGFLLQELVIDLGEHLMHKLVDFLQFDSHTGTDQAAVLVRPGDTRLPEMGAVDSESNMLYFELFQLHPIKLSFSFAKLEGRAYDETEFYSAGRASAAAAYNPIMTLANVFLTVLQSISDAPLKFNALLLEHPIVRQNVLMGLIKDHYAQQAITQVYRGIGSIDFLGNPVGLFNNFSSGVSDFFYEPLLGLVSDRPGDIGIGLAKGSLSLVRKTVVGLTDTFSKLTGSLGKGATMLTFDPAFQQKRRMMHARNQPKHALGGVMASAKHLFSGVASGISGIVEKPVEGAKEGGVSGFFKGVGVGLLGVVVKPAVGVLDATTSLTEGIKNTADSDANDLSQVRLPRPVPYDQVIRAYSEHAAKGQSILYCLHQRAAESSPAYSLYRRRREYYVAHLEVPADSAIALVTTEAVILVEATASYRVVWRVPLEEVVYVRPHRDVILVVVRQRDVKQRMIFVADPALQEWFAAQVEEAMVVFNESRSHT